MEIPSITSLCHLIIILIYHFRFDFEYRMKVLLSDTITGKDGVCQNCFYGGVCVGTGVAPSYVQGTERKRECVEHKHCLLRELVPAI
jgi:hypothetical protein